MNSKRGDLEVTIYEARNLGAKGNVYCSVELKSHTHHDSTKARTYCTKDAKWNQTFNFDLMSLDNDELLVQVWCKRNVKKDKFLGQSSIRIAALNLSKEAEWRFLTDKPEIELKTSEGNLEKKKDIYIICGEILLKLLFIHRLLRRKSNESLANSTKASSPFLPPQRPTIRSESPIDSSITEEAILDKALKEKQKLVKEKLEQSKSLIRTSTSPITKSEGTRDETFENIRLEAIQKSMSELEKILDSTYAPEDIRRSRSPPLQSVSFDDIHESNSKSTNTNGRKFVRRDTPRRYSNITSSPTAPSDHPSTNTNPFSSSPPSELPAVNPISSGSSSISFPDATHTRSPDSPSTAHHDEQDPLDAVDPPDIPPLPTSPHIATAHSPHSVSKSLRGAHGVLLIPSSQFEHTNDQQIGMGAQGVAYKTKWKSRDVVFKKLFLSQQDREHKRSFLRELEVWRNIHHPNSVALFGAVDDSNVVGYVMEFCANGNLQEHMKKGLVFGPLKTVDLACKIADILSVLHDSAIAHRDVKSANIMLDHDFVPKLGDFGLSQMLATMQASATNLAGTPTHMAPEQYISGAKHNPLKADVYSFGMLMYELATNQIPFNGLHLFEICRKLEQGIRPPIAKGTPVGMEDDEQRIWWDILTQCWAQDPMARPSMDQVHHKLTSLSGALAKRIKGFCCKAHKIGHHDYFLSYRVASESPVVHQLYDSLTQTKRNSGVALKVFLDAKCLPDAEDWQKSFLYGLHHTKIIIPIISTAGLKHFHKAHEENDNVLLEYEHMLSLLTLLKGQVKVFPIFIDTFPRASEYPDLPHITTGKSIRKTLEGILRLQGKRIKVDALDEVIPALLEKLDELETGANSSLTITSHTIATKSKDEHTEVFIQVEGEDLRDDCVEVSPETTLQSLRAMIAEQLDDFEFEYKFIKVTGSRPVVINVKQEGIKTVKDIIDQDSNVTLRKIV